jgi:uncharacterized membrane protein
MPPDQPVIPPTPQLSTPPIGPQRPHGIAIAAIISGIFAFFCGWIPFFGLIIGVVAIILGITSLKRHYPTPMGVGAIVGGGIGFLTSIVTTGLLILSLTIGLGFIQGAPTDSISDQLRAENEAYIQTVLNEKKDFAKGETLRFNRGWDVKVNSVTRNYPVRDDGTRFTDNTGKEFVVLNVTVTNVSVAEKDLPFFPSNAFTVFDGSTQTETVFSFPVTPDPQFVGNAFVIGESKTGNVGFNIPAGTGELKLVLDFPLTLEDGKKNLRYTLEI